ncbi:MAG TPA: M20/M25/M40 family metallo-hydrolase [Armatimonadetes bacterium]|nr:M20/M25/M40 family metallo-hydrolase [Armatimonadota bacterium]
MVDPRRLKALFLELLRIDSAGGREGEICDFVARRLEEIGAEVEVDDASKRIGGTGGNVIAKFPGQRKGPSLLLNAHLDTVSSTEGLKIIEEEDLIRSDGTTILGADDKAGVAIVLEAVRALSEQSIPHVPIEVVLTIREEKGLLGAKALDTSKLSARYGFVLDGGEREDELVVEAPTHDNFVAVIEGKAAHAGVEPEKGVNAIAVASSAISRVKWGRLDELTTCNVGLIKGGEARNIVPDRCEVQGEARSRDKRRLEEVILAIRAAFEGAAREFGAKLEFSVERSYEGYKIEEGEPQLEAAKSAIRSLGMEPKLLASGGGTDANIFVQRGIRCVILPTGAAKVHTKEEYIRPSVLARCCQILVRAIEEFTRRAT